MKSLYDRLKAQREAREGAPGSPAVGSPAPTSSRPPADPNSPARREALLPEPWRRVADQVWEARFQKPASAEIAALRSAATDGVLSIGNPEDACFFDTETTGLSGGAGTLCFLFAAANVRGTELHTQLLFLADFAGEPEFLDRVGRVVEAAGTVVSYNGKRFDAPLLSGRFLMNRMPPVLRPHVDLLFPTRRLFARVLPGCSLGTVERAVLGVRRDLDLPGEEVPERYFSFLRSGNAALLSEVFSHVRYDVSSLVRLAAHIERIGGDGADGADGAMSPADRLGVGRLLLEQPYRGRRPYNAALRDAGINRLCELAEEIDHPDSLSAAQRVTAVLRRSGEPSDLDRAVVIWRRFVEERRSLWATVELAKYLEHRRRAYREAEELVRTAMMWPHCGAYRGELERRLARVSGKAARR